MHVYCLNKETKEYLGEGEHTDIDVSVQTDIEMLQTDVAPNYEEFEYLNEEHCILEFHPFRWTGTGWELI